MRYLLISIVLFLFSGCKVTTVKDFTKSDIKTDDMVRNPYFSDVALDYVYKADIAVYGNEFSGILIIKKVGLEKHRIVFTSQFGSTFFDIELSNGSHKIISIVAQLDRKIILNTLVRDFSLLIKENGIVSEKYYNSVFTVLKNPKDQRSNYYFYNQSDKKLNKIVHATKRKEKFAIRFIDSPQEHLAEQIRIDHKNIKLNIALNLLKK